MKIRRQKTEVRRQIFINRDGETRCLDIAVIAMLAKSARQSQENKKIIG